MKLSRSTNDRVLFGVCGGIGRYLGIDSPLVRLGFIIGTIFTGSILFWIYILLGIFLPYDDIK